MDRIYIHEAFSLDGDIIERTEYANGDIRWVTLSADYAKKDGVWHYLGDDIKTYGDICDHCETKYLSWKAH